MLEFTRAHSPPAIKAKKRRPRIVSDMEDKDFKGVGVCKFCTRHIQDSTALSMMLEFTRAH